MSRGPIRVLEAVADGAPGGGTAHVLQLVEALRQAPDFEPLLLSQRDSYALERAHAQGVAAHGLEFFRYGRLNPATCVALRRLCRQLRPDIVHAHGARVGLPMSFALKVGPPPRLLYTVHGYHFAAKPGPGRTLGALAERRCSARADFTVFVCEHDRRLAGRSGILAHCRRQRVIPNGIETDRLPRQRVPVRGLLGFAGRLVPQKDPLRLIEILACLRDRDVRLVVLGDGPLRAAMAARAAALGLQERVELRGSLPREAALRALAEVDVLLLPSLWEGLPLVVLEALAIGVPVVASAVGGVPEIIESERSGFLVDDQAPERYAAAVRRLLDSPELRAAIVARGRAVVAERFSWAATEQRYLDLYREALAV